MLKFSNNVSAIEIGDYVIVQGSDWNKYIGLKADIECHIRGRIITMPSPSVACCVERIVGGEAHWVYWGQIKLVLHPNELEKMMLDAGVDPFADS